MKILKQSTASTLLLGPFVDSTDGFTAETALTLSQADVLLWKEGGTTLAQKTEATSCTHRSIGMYTCPIDTTDTNTLGILTVTVNESGALPVRHDYYVVPANVYDALKAGTGVGVRADIQGYLGTATPAADTAGYPKVTVKDGTGTGEIDTASGKVSVVTADLAAIMTQQMTEAYAADGVAPTPAQALFLILQALTEFSISGTTLTIKKLDGSTTGAVLTLNSSTAPTSVTRTT